MAIITYTLDLCYGEVGRDNQRKKRVKGKIKISRKFLSAALAGAMLVAIPVTIFAKSPK